MTMEAVDLREEQRSHALYRNHQLGPCSKFTLEISLRSIETHSVRLALDAEAPAIADRSADHLPARLS